MTDEQIELIMEQAQVFASAWSLVGGPFDTGGMLETAEEEKKALRALLSASKPAVPEGWKLVPVEPTQPMRDAFFADGGIERVDWLTKGYAAMLAASPAAGSE